MSFIFNGINSQAMGLYVVHMDSGEVSNPFMSAQEIKEEECYNSHIPAFFGVKKKPLEFEITCSLLDEEFTLAKKMELGRWLCKETYCDFISEDNPEIIYSVIMTNQADFMSVESFKGYFKLQFRANAPWGYSPSYLNTFDLSTITVPTTITVTSYCNVLLNYYPEIEFTLASTNTGLSLKNLSNGGLTSTFTGLTQLETIYINNEKKQIISDLSLYRLSKFNKIWLKLVYGVNRIEVTGKCTLSFRCKFPLLA